MTARAAGYDYLQTFVAVSDPQTAPLVEYPGRMTQLAPHAHNAKNVRQDLAHNDNTGVALGHGPERCDSVTDTACNR